MSILADQSYHVPILLSIISTTSTSLIRIDLQKFADRRQKNKEMHFSQTFVEICSAQDVLFAKAYETMRFNHIETPYSIYLG